MVESGNDNNKAFFPKELVQQTYWINHDEHGEERARLFQENARNIHLNAERVPAIYGSDVSEEEMADIIPRVRGRIAVGDGENQKFFGNLEHSQLNSPDKKGALGTWGCQASHIEAMKKALENVKEGDNRWVIILEDDVNLSRHDRDALLKGLEDAPKDAGAVMLTSQHRLWQGAVPVETGHDNLVKPVQATSAAAIAYRPDMLRLMLPVYEANRDATREDGGVIAADHVNCIIQEWLTLGKEPPQDRETRPELHRLLDIFKAEVATQNMEGRNAFYALNPSVVRVHEIKSTIGEKSTSARMNIDNPLKPASKETALAIREVMPQINAANSDRAHSRPLEDARKAVDDAVKEGSTTAEGALATLKRISAYMRPAQQRCR